MNAYVIWIDREHAKIFQVSEEKMERKTLQANRIAHHTHELDAFDKEIEENRLFKDAASQLKNAEKLLILGPGVAKHHFQTYLVEQHPALAKKIAACETVDHPSDAQIAAYAKKYFAIGPIAKAL